MLAFYASIWYQGYGQEPIFNSRQRKTLLAIFSDPVPASLEWTLIEAVLRAAGCRIVEGAGSRVRFVHGTDIATFHRPHPGKEAKRYQASATNYLMCAHF